MYGYTVGRRSQQQWNSPDSLATREKAPGLDLGLFTRLGRLYGRAGCVLCTLLHDGG